jgi:8-oxo-dGTP diphosphatase
MPDRTASLSVDRIYSATEFEQLKRGQVPEQMEDKWFIYFDEPLLYLHRSWTGFCIYRVAFEPCNDGFRISEVIANRDADQYQESNDERDALLLTILLDGRAGRSTEKLWKQYTASVKGA